jgi:hypothetical protein
MGLYIAVLMAFTGGFAIMLCVSEMIYNLLVFVYNKLEERDNKNE